MLLANGAGSATGAEPKVGIAGSSALTLVVARAALDTTRERALVTRFTAWRRVELALRRILPAVLRAFERTFLIDARARPATLRALDLTLRAVDLALDFNARNPPRLAFVFALERGFFFAMETVSQKTVV